jgi:hypothetical protein
MQLKYWMSPPRKLERHYSMTHKVLKLILQFIDENWLMFTTHPSWWTLWVLSWSQIMNGLQTSLSDVALYKFEILLIGE